MNPKKLFSAVFILLLMLGFVLSFSPTVHAASFDSQCNNNSNSASSISCTLSTVTAGDVVVVLVEIYGGSGCSTALTSGMLTGVTGSTLSVSICNLGAVGMTLGIYTATATSTGAEVPLVTDGAGYTYYIQAYAVTGSTTIGMTTSSDALNPNQINSGTSITDSVSAFALRSDITFAAHMVESDTTLFSSFTQPSGFATYGCNSNARNQGCSTYSFSASGSSTLANSYSWGASQTRLEALTIAISIGSGTASSQSQTIGSCTATATGGTYLTNNTQYWYSGNALGQQVVNNITTSVENIKGSGSHSLQLMIYGTAGVAFAQSPSITYPAVLLFSTNPVVISSGTTNKSVTWQVNIPLNTNQFAPLPFNFWAAAIVGDDHIRIHNSATSGMTTQTGTASTAAQPTSFTSQGSASAVKLALCAKGNYQSLIAVTSTTSLSATSTTFTTSTFTVSTIGPALFSTASNWPVLFLILLLPAGLFLGVTKTLAGALLGLMVGSVIGLMMGVLPPFVFVGILIALTAIAFISRERAN